ncbi:MAG: TolC family protein [Bacteroidetes bacterium]|nr:TolC family protein [Bacteroidota bacterium]
MKKIIILTLISVTSLLAQASKLTLTESIEIGMKNSKELKISHSKLVSASAQVTSATSQMLPQLGFSAGYMRLSDIPPFEVSLPIFAKPIQISPVILDNYNLKLSLQQPLFTGFRLMSLKNMAQLNYQATESDFNSDKNDEALRIQRAFWNYYKAQQNDKVLGENLQQIKQHLDDTKNFAANGLATQNDVLKIEVQYSSTQLQKIEADNMLDIARMTFNQAIGLPLDSQTEIEAGDLATTKVNYNLKGLLNEARSSRNELKSLQYRVEASSKNVTASQSPWFPSLYLIGDYYYSKPNSRYLPAINEFKNTWDVGVQLSWSLWNWGYTSSQTTIAEQNKIQVETSLSQLKDAVEIEVYQDYLTFKRAFDKVNVSKLGVKQAEENYRMIKDKYNSQVASSTDLIDAETALLAAKTYYVNSLVDYEIAKVRLDKSVGKKIY